MNQRVKHRIILSSLLFGMFFGAGNLIFPVFIGQNAASKTPIGMLGFIISAVGLTCLAVIFTAKSKQENLEASLRPYGRHYARIFTVALLLTIGPLFALPRTATVPFEVSVRLMFANTDSARVLFVYSWIFFSVVLILSLKPTKLKEMIGKYINPLFLVMLLISFGVFFIKPMGNIQSVNSTELYQVNPFLKGFEGGYQTMDVLAAMMFGFVIIHSNDKKGSSNQQFMDVVFAALLASAMMIIIYLVLGLMGASSVNILNVSSNGGLALGEIFIHYFGKSGLFFFGLLISFACLKTAIGLVVACSTYFSSILPKVHYNYMVVIIVLVSFGVSNFGLETIIQYAVPILNFIYPLALMHVFVGLFIKQWEKKTLMLNSLLIFTLFASFIEVIKTFSSIKNHFLIHFYTHNLPLANIGLSWVNFSLFGLVFGMFLSKRKESLTQSL